ncbi:perforin-1-like [Hyla sarda]|uniref:perforin-1-like n=1 Tax=Hyla sarda TaxID=327740 RepID=UPI0024C46793|nr:perforin-1-like [Hyla sarda]
MYFILILLLSVSYASAPDPPPLTYACRSANVKECHKLPFVPGHTLLGEGLDVVTMKKKGSYLFNLQRFITGEKTCTVCSNPYMEKAWQKLPLGVVDWMPKSMCSKKISGETSRSTSSLAEESASSIENNWEAGLEIHHKAGDAKMVLAGSQSQLAQFGQTKSSGDRYTFMKHQLNCIYYGLRLSQSHMPPLSRHFSKNLKSLPATYDTTTQEKYRHLITTYGTHYISQANVGGEAQQVTAVRTCHATVDGLSLDELKDCLSMEASAAITGKVEVNAKTSACKELSSKSNHGESFHQTYNERIWKVSGGAITYDLLSFDTKNSDSAATFEKWMDTLKTDPDIVSYSLEPIHNLVKEPKRENLKKALRDYIMEKALRQNCSCPSGSVLSPGAECSCVCQGNDHLNSNCCPSKKGFAKLVVTIERAENLWGDYTTKTDAYVKVSYGKTNSGTSTIWNNDNPTWNLRLDLGTLELSSAPLLKVEVWDEDNKYDDDLLGSCTKNVNSGVKAEVCYLDHGSVSFTVSAGCIPHLTGHLCREYAASTN